MTQHPQSDNAFEQEKARTSARDRSELTIETVRQHGGVFVEAVRATRMPMVLTDPALPGNPIVFANTSFLELTGYDMEEVLGQQPFFLNGAGTDPADVERFRQILASDRDDVVESVQYAKDGRRFVANVLLSAFKDDSGRILHHFLSWGDVTRRVDAESDLAALRATDRALRASETRLRSVLDSIAEGFALFDADFTIRDVNVETLRMDGRGRDELIGLSHWAAFPGTEDSAVGELFKRVMRERTPGSLEHQYEWPDGRKMWIEVRAYPSADGRIACFWRDVTARKAADAALLDSEQRYRRLFESMDEAYSVVEVLKDRDGAWSDFRFIQVNPAFMQHTAMPWPVGKTASELLGVPNPRWAQLYGRALDSGVPIRIQEEEPALGRIFDLNIFTLDRERNRVAVLFTNITERKTAEAALRSSEARLEVLVTELQHRTRNLMGVVRSTARWTADASSDLDEFLERFRDRLDALSRVQGLLSRLGETDRVAFDELIRTELAAMNGSPDRVTLDGPTGVRLRSSVVQTLAMAIHELATNAVKYGALGQPGGRLSVSWQFMSPDMKGQPRLRIDWRESGVAMPAVDAKPRGGGQGRELIEKALPYQLEAETSFELGADGVRCTITIPVSTSNVAGA